MKPEWILCPKCKEIVILKEKNMHQEGMPGKWIPKDFADEMDKRQSIIKEIGKLLEAYYDYHTGLSDNLPIGTVEETWELLDRPEVKTIMKP
jgi:hypothetical protein